MGSEGRALAYRAGDVFATIDLQVALEQNYGFANALIPNSRDSVGGILDPSRCRSLPAQRNKTMVRDAAIAP
jgi:hypothetical protein